ncbi:uncharacterized protein MONBRDRAFT_12454 [Monosiga brevicollis MX1]|uniref:Protein YIPF n=1 Tax=Monosiga brevicollis TaxID=81824 RepID=A9VCB6_MONBE|nr:uncharacterized protein MONBRDRAFT_12454 [Monosiga brevicollis MX1]EDQ84832.1 predicted protein [Monosiga brevicollis MX1]|eukprot:XP_001750333.1 hypothetical protein [Monosiga brevicollis MX1]
MASGDIGFASVEHDVNFDDLAGSIDQEAVADQQLVQMTLDEPVWDTLKRDLVAIGRKFYYVFVPHRSKALLHDWDLWGPMILTMTLALMLRSSAGPDFQSEVFAGVFFIICVGATVITVNNQLLGGYCILPLVTACLLLKLISAISTHLALRTLVVAVALAWSIYASFGFVSGQSPVKRRALVLYPIVLYYIVIAWLVLNDAPVASHAAGSAAKTTPAPTTVPTQGS